MRRKEREGTTVKRDPSAHYTTQGLTLTADSGTTNTGVIILSSGTYTIKLAKQGFADNEKPNLRLETAQSASLDFVMQVTGAKETVVVTSDDQTQLLVTESSGLESTIENKLVVDLPSGERSATAKDDCNASRSVCGLSGIVISYSLRARLL